MDCTGEGPSVGTEAEIPRDPSRRQGGWRMSPAGHSPLRDFPAPPHLPPTPPHRGPRLVDSLCAGESNYFLNPVQEGEGEEGIN